MNEHSTSEPAATGGTTHPHPVDLVAGDPPVPITVWRTARSDADTSPTVSARLAYRLVAAYSRPGEAVVDLTDTHALTTACLRGGREHHRAWFTTTASMVTGPATEPASNDDLDQGEVEPAVAWFGDDLTDPEPATGEAENPSQRTSLVVASWPLDLDPTTHQARVNALLTAAVGMLRPGGCLVLVVGVPSGVVTTPEDFTPVVDAASTAGLGYLQHIVAVTADTDGDRFTYHATDEELLTLAHARDTEQFVLHAKVHADLLVFTTPVRKAGDGRRG
jgi:hypothetical protein